MKSSKDIYLAVGERLLARRQELKLSQREVGERMGVGYNCILQWEKGKKGMSVRTLKALCDALEMPLVIGGKELKGK